MKQRQCLGTTVKITLVGDGCIFSAMVHVC